MRVIVTSGAGLAGSLASLVAGLSLLEQGTQRLPTFAITRTGQELDFYPMRGGKETAQWKRETHGKRLK